METLASDPKVLFIGQAVEYPGTAISNTLTNVPKNQLLELPVFEDTQMGMTLGLAIAGFIPVSIFPRWNFLICATNQLVNHIDKINSMSNFQHKIIIRTSIGSERPLNPQHQHIGDYTDAIKLLCKNIDVIRLDHSEQIIPSYIKAYERRDGKPTLLVEYGDFYNEK
jgi:pyruvate/2-oxoglutarate/acetoin dehydrogenase E1 component